MKVRIDLPDVVCREVERAAFILSMTPNQFYAEAIDEHLRCYARKCGTGDYGSPWMAGFGALSDLASENKTVLEMIEAEFEESPAREGDG